jgi:methionyl aminopeptidase
MGDVAHAIGTVARAGGYGLVDDHGGHGVGRAMHEAPSVPNEGRPGRGLPLRPGLVIALEPMLQAGGADAYRHDRDGWTIRTADGSRATHAEHTIAITEDGPRVLTTGRPTD